MRKISTEKRKARMQALYCERKYNSLRKKGTQLTDVTDDEGEETKTVVTKEDAMFTPEARLCIMELTGLEVATEKIAPVMESVGSLCNTKFSNLPSRQACQKIIDEGQFVAKMYVKEKLLESGGFGLHKDGTSRRKVKILDTSVQLESGESFCLGWSSTSAETGKAIADEAVEKLGELRDTEDTSMVKELVSRLKYYMNDRAANEKKSNEFLDRWREDVLKESSEDNLPVIHHLFCSAHVLLGFHNYTLSSLAKIGAYESQDGKHPITKLLKDASDMFGPVGDFRGLRNQWEAYCVDNGIKSTIKSYKDNRFNGLFEISAQVYYHHQDFIRILSQKSACNFKQNRLLHSLKSPHLLLLLECLGLFFHRVTGPLWSMCISKKMSFHDFVPLIKSLQQWLDNVSENPYLFFEVDSFPLISQFKASSQDTKGSMTGSMKEGMVEVIITISTALSNTIKAQLSDFLEGGKYSDPSKLLDCSFAPLSNLVCERNFGHLDASQRRRPHGSLHHHTSVMLLKQTRTKLRQWFNKMNLEERKALWERARKKGKLLRKTHQDQDKKAIMEALPTLKEVDVDPGTIDKTLEKGSLWPVKTVGTQLLCKSESAPGHDVTVDFAELGKLLGAFKWPSGRDIYTILRSSILETDVTMNLELEDVHGW